MVEAVGEITVKRKVEAKPEPPWEHMVVLEEERPKARRMEGSMGGIVNKSEKTVVQVERIYWALQLYADQQPEIITSVWNAMKNELRNVASMSILSMTSTLVLRAVRSSYKINHPLPSR